MTVRKREEGWDEREHEFDLYLVYLKCEYLYHSMCYSAASLHVYMFQGRVPASWTPFGWLQLPQVLKIRTGESRP